MTTSIELEREDDGRWLASVEDMPGVMAYGATEEEARENVARIIAELESHGISPATLDDVLDGAAHIVADGDILRAGNPALLTDDPDAPMAIIVSLYPEPGMPDSVEVMRLESTDAPDSATLQTALREKYFSFSAEWDDR